MYLQFNNSQHNTKLICYIDDVILLMIFNQVRTMPIMQPIITINDIQQHIHNWLYNIAQPINVAGLLLHLYPNAADYIKPGYSNSEEDKLQFLLDLRQYIEDEILGFDPTNTYTRPVIGLKDQVNAEIGFRLSDMYQLQEQQIQLQYYIENNRGGLEISPANIERLSLDIHTLAIDAAMHDNSKKQLLILSAELVLVKTLLKVYNQELPISSVALNISDIHVFLNNIKSNPTTDLNILRPDIEIFVCICWNLWQLDILEVFIQSGIRLPGFMFLINEFPQVIATNDRYSASIIQRLTSQVEIEDITEPKALMLTDRIPTPENSEPSESTAMPEVSSTSDTETETETSTAYEASSIPEATAASEDISDISEASTSPETTAASEVSIVPEAPADSEEPTEISESTKVIDKFKDLDVEILPFQQLKQAVTDLKSAKFNTIIQQDPTMLTPATAMLKTLITGKNNSKRNKNIIKFISAIQLPLDICNELVFKANDAIFPIMQSKIEAHEAELQKQFQNYLDSNATVLPPELRSLMTKQLHIAINDLNLDRVKFLMSKGADEYAKNDADDDALAILLKKISTTKVDDNIIAIGHAIDADIVHTATLSAEQGKKAEKIGKEGLLFKYYTDKNKNALNHEEFLDIVGTMTNETEIRFQSLLQHASYKDSKGRPLLTICLQKNFTTTALKVIEACTFTGTVKDKQGNTFLHSWAQYTPENIELLKALLKIYKAPKDDTEEDLNNEYGDSFLHSLLRNPKVTEDIAFRALNVIFKTTDISFLRVILATKNKNDNTAIVLSEIRGWKKVTKYLGQTLAELIEHLALKEVNIKSYFKHAMDYFNQKSKNGLIHRKLKTQEYGEIQRLIEARDEIRSNIKNITKQVEFDDNGAFYAIVRLIFGSFDYYEIYVDGIFLIDHITNLSKSNPTPGIMSIMLSPMIPRLLTESPLTDSIFWEKIILNCKVNGFTRESRELLNKLKEHSTAFKVDPNITDVENANMLDYAAGLGDLDLTKAVMSEFNLTIKPKTLLNACASYQELDTPEHTTLAYLCDLYEKSRVTDPSLPRISEIRDGATLDMLCKAAFTCRNISKFKWLLQRGYDSDKPHIYGNNILQLVIINTGASANTAKLDCSYTLSIIKELLSHNPEKFRQMVIHRDEFGGTSFDQTLAIEHKSKADVQPFYEILELLISNGANLTNVTNCGQNILHYVANSEDQQLAAYIKEKIIKAHGSVQLDKMHKQTDAEGLTPMMLADAKNSNIAVQSTIRKLGRLVMSS